MASLSAARWADMELGCSATPSRLFACGSDESAQERLGSAVRWLGAATELLELDEARDEADLVDMAGRGGVYIGLARAGRVEGCSGWQAWYIYAVGLELEPLFRPFTSLFASGIWISQVQRREGCLQGPISLRLPAASDPKHRACDSAAVPGVRVRYGPPQVYRNSPRRHRQPDRPQLTLRCVFSAQFPATRSHLFM